MKSSSPSVGWVLEVLKVLDAWDLHGFSGFQSPGSGVKLQTAGGDVARRLTPSLWRAPNQQLLRVEQCDTRPITEGSDDEADEDVEVDEVRGRSRKTKHFAVLALRLLDLEIPPTFTQT